MALFRNLVPCAAAMLLAAAATACAHNDSGAMNPPSSQVAASSQSNAPAASEQASPQMTNPDSSASTAMASPTSNGVSPTSPTPPGAASFTDAQIQSFARASVQVDRIQARHQTQLSGTPEQQAAARTQLSTELAAALQAQNITPETYNAIARAARSDQSLAQRIVTARTQAGAPS